MTKTEKPLGFTNRHLPRGVRVLHDDKDIVVIDKPHMLLTVGTDKDRERTAYFAMTDFVRKGSSKSKNRVFVVHRLEKEVSGVLIFAKTPKAKDLLQEQWEKAKKKYIAVVQGHFEKKTDTLTSYLVENKALRVYSTPDAEAGQLASMRYRVIKETKRYSLLEIEPQTARKNQIRVQLADAGHPIVGDKKYGDPEDFHKRLALHAISVAIKHPFDGKPMNFQTNTPDYFKRLLGGGELP